MVSWAGETIASVLFAQEAVGAVMLRRGRGGAGQHVLLCWAGMHAGGQGVRPMRSTERSRHLLTPLSQQTRLLSLRQATIPFRQAYITPAAHLIATSAVGAAASVTVSASGPAVAGSTLSTPGASTAWLASAVVSRRFGVVEMSTAPDEEAGCQVPQPSGSSVTVSGVAATLTFCRTSAGEAPWNGRNRGQGAPAIF